MPKKKAGKKKTPKPSASDGPLLVSKLPKLPERPADAHKGDFGHVLVLGGSRGMIGAPALVADAALRSGAGLVTIACPDSIQQAVAILCPCATTIPLPELSNGQLDPLRAIKAIDDSRSFGNPAKPTVIAAGPGLGHGNVRFDDAWRELVREFAGDREVPIVLDADGLNAMPAIDPANDAPTAFDGTNLVITPHPGEFARLCNTTAADVQDRRMDAILEAARKVNAAPDVTDHNRCTILLKGDGTLVSDGARMFMNFTGNPGMATGGCGDVLTGVIAALIGQGMSRFDAAALGARLHGEAGDVAANELTMISMKATDVIACLPEVFATDGLE